MWAELLQLENAPRMRFEMTVFDSRFLEGGLRWETLLIGEDVPTPANVYVIRIQQFPPDSGSVADLCSPE